jgi:hypothetical protein
LATGRDPRPAPTSLETGAGRALGARMGKNAEVEMNKLRNFIRRKTRAIVHPLIRRYLIKCAGSFHTGNYGLYGNYVVLMTDAEYALWKNGKRPGLLSLYRDGDSFFLALQDFGNLQDSRVIWLDKLTVAKLLKENANNQEDERLFWESVMGERVEWR